MSILKLQLKVYIDKYGNQYLDGARNVLFPIYKLSNNVYELNLITEIESPTVKVSFEKADGTITNAYIMTLSGNELVGNATWNVYKMTIPDDVLDISEKVGNNTLCFSFNYSDSEITLNSTPICVKCSYSINGVPPTLTASDFDKVMASIQTTFLERNKDRVYHVNLLPQIIEDETSDNYNLGFVYVLDGKYTEISEVPTTPIQNIAYLWKGENRTEFEPLFENGKYYEYSPDKYTSNANWAELKNFAEEIGNCYVINTDKEYELIFYGKDSYDKAIQRIADLEFMNSNNQQNILSIMNKNTKQDERLTALENEDETLNALIETNISSIEALESELNSYKTLNDTKNSEQDTAITNLQSSLTTTNETISNNKAEFDNFKTTNSQAITNMGTTSVNTAKTYTDGKVDTINTELAKKLNKDLTNIGVQSHPTADTDYMVINRGSDTYKISILTLKSLFGSSDTEQVVNHYKGNFNTLEELQAITGVAGDYAFVVKTISESDTVLVMYIWNATDNAWEETNTSQYVLTSDFETYKTAIANGEIIVGKTQNYDTNEGNIKTKFEEIENTIANINAVTVIDGTTLEDVDYEEGRLYYVNESSDSFTKNSMYYGKESGGIMKLSASEVSLDPAILTFSVTGAVATEIGNTTNLTGYSMTLKKYAKFNSISIASGSTSIATNLTPSASMSGSLSATLQNTSVGTKTITATGTLIEGGTKTKSTSYQVYARQYYGASLDETLTSETGTALFGSVTISTDSLKTYLLGSRVSSLTISLGDTPTYLYFVIPTNMTINSIVSGPLSFPFIQQSNITITNSYNTGVACKVYRSANKVYGDISLTIS